MSIRRQPKREEDKARKLIAKADAPILADSAYRKVLLSIPDDVLARVDSSCSERRVRTPRNSWILEAIIQALETGEED